jgi:anti-sigma factor RsiW
MTEPDTHLTPEDEAELVALADGNLSPARRAEMEARVAAEPALADALARQRKALAMLADLDTPAPLELRLRVEELKAHRRRLWRGRWVPAAFLATASVTAALLLVLISGGPAVEDVFAGTQGPATAPAAGSEQIDGVGFPQPEGWQAVGTRTDNVGGRATRTVFYEKGDQRIAYTIVARPALQEHDWVMRSGHLLAYAWPKDGRTCIISGSVDEATLRKAATWQ